MKPSSSPSKILKIARPPHIPAPWSPAYNSYHDQYISSALSNAAIREFFREGWQLPDNYGIGIDERCIEFPWYFEVASADAKTILDAGSALNYPFAVAHPYFKNRKLTILTLAPEENCFWKLGISYQYGDMRDLPYRDHYFDEIVCISTIEHVGMDNSLFTGTTQSTYFNENEFTVALKELNRILKPGGRLLVSVPFGKYENWGEFQQFDSALLDKAAEAFDARNRQDSFYYYTADGWKLTTDRKKCQNMSYSRHALNCQWGTRTSGQLPEADLAAAARAVACCVWEK